MRNGSLVSFATLSVVSNIVWQAARADGVNGSVAQLDVAAQQTSLGAAMTPMLDASATSTFVAAWQARAAQVRANQPSWSSPLITTTGMLEQRRDRWRSGLGPHRQQQ